MHTWRNGEHTRDTRNGRKAVAAVESTSKTEQSLSRRHGSASYAAVMSPRPYAQECRIRRYSSNRTDFPRSKFRIKTLRSSAFAGRVHGSHSTPKSENPDGHSLSRYATWKNFYRHAKLLATETVSSYFVIVLPRYFYRQVAIPLDGKFFRAAACRLFTVRFTVKCRWMGGDDSTRGRPNNTLLVSDLSWDTRAVYYV